jgi:hydroxymethylbilane synthase
VSLVLSVGPELYAEALPLVEAMGRSGFTVAVVTCEDGGEPDPATRVATGAAHLALVPVEHPRPLPAGVVRVGVPKRAEPRDVLVPMGGDSATLQNLAPGTRVGVAGVRRASFLRAHRPDVEVVALLNGGGPGAALAAGTLGAAILGATEARRINLKWRATEILDAKSWIPGACQGAAALLARDDDGDAARAAGSVDHGLSHASLLAESRVVEGLGAGRDRALGVLALPHERWIRLWAMLASEDGSRVVRGDVTGPIDDPVALARRLCELLRARGADDLIHGSAQ